MSETRLRVLIVDDEPLAQQRLAWLLAQEPGIEWTLCASDGREAIELVVAERPDLLLLDVEMPELDGFAVLRGLGPQDMPPAVVFVTAFDQHALRAFESRALDYLLKPVHPERLRESLRRARERVRLGLADKSTQELMAFIAERGEGQGAPVYLRRLTVREGQRTDVVPVEQIDLIESAGNYVTIQCGTRVHVLRETLNRLEAQLDPKQFVRVGRGAMVQVDRVVALQALPSGGHQVQLRDGRKLAATRGVKELERLFRYGV